MRSRRRAETERLAQDEVAREDARLKELDAMYILAKEATASKRASAGEAREVTRRHVLETQAQRKTHKEEVEFRRANLSYLQQNIAADLVAKAYAWVKDKTLGAKRVAALRLLVKENKSTKLWTKANRAVLDAAWAGDVRVGYVLVTPTAGLTSSRSPKEWASERMVRAIFGGRDPGESKTAEAIWSRLNTLLEDVAPGYTSLFKGCHLSTDLLKRHGRSVDLSLISGLQRYCLVLPEDVFPCQVRTWPWSDDQVALWVRQHKSAHEGLMSVGPRVAEVIRPSKRVRRPVEPSFPIAALVSSTRDVPEKDSSRDEPVVAVGERKRKRLRPVGAVMPSALETPSSCSTDVAPCSLFSKWAAPP